MKGLSLPERMTKMQDLIDYSIYVETDYQRFDASVSLDYLQNVEFLFLTLSFPHNDHQLYNKALRSAHHTYGVSEIGLSYDIAGTRCSGDAHTSIGNGLINHFNTWLCFRSLPPDSWTSYHEGDDGVIAIRDNLDQMLYNLHIMPSLGFQLKMSVVKDIKFVSFCGRFLGGTKELLSVCDIKRTLAKIHTICSDGDPSALALAKMLSYYHTDSSTPFVGAFVTSIIRILRPIVSNRRLTRAVQHLNRDFWFRAKFRGADFMGVDYPFVDPCAEKRALVALRTGWSPGMQIVYENYYKSFVTLGFIPSTIHRLPGDWTFMSDSQVYGPVCNYVL